MSRIKIEFSYPNMTVGKLAKMCGGTLTPESMKNEPVIGINTDSGESAPGYVFVTLHGQRADGFEFVNSAMEKGCQCVLCEQRSEEIEQSGIAAIVVSNTELALSLIANEYRRKLKTKVIGVTGSVGKSTTKDLIGSVLRTTYRSYSSPGNHNSVIGLPLSLLQMTPDTEWSVLEMGMSALGEIERLSLMAEPDIAVITNIGTAHMEYLGSKENIRRAKLEILSGLKDGGTLVLNGDDPMLQNIGGTMYRTVYVSTKNPNAEFYADNIKFNTLGTAFDLHHNGNVYRNINIRVLGAHNVYDALYAIAVSVEAGIDMKDIRAGLWGFHPQELTQNRFTLNGITFIEDCYNASPESVIAALDVLAEYAGRKQGRSFAVLGDMLELGSDSSTLHQNVGEHLVKRNIEYLITLGQEGGQIAVGACRHGMKKDHIIQDSNRDDVESMGERIMSMLRPGDVVLVKGSRKVGLENMVNYWRKILTASAV